MEFRPITIDDKDLFDEFFRRYPPIISEMTFTNLFSWRNSKGHQFALIDDHLLIKAHDFYYQPVGARPDEMMRKMLEKDNIIFDRVEKSIADKHQDLHVEETKDMFDYVYEVKDLVELKGNKYEAKRNQIKQCESLSPEVCMLDESNIHDFFDLQDRWCELRGCEDDSPLEAENEAIKEALHNFRKFKLIGVCIRKDDDIQGFAIGEKLNDNAFVEHFEKGDTRVKGIYQYTLREFSKKIPGRFRFLNREQDLGIKGIRKAKESYYPVKMVKKCSVKRP